MQAAIPLTMVLGRSTRPVGFTVAYRLVGFSMIPVGIELTDLALRVWGVFVPSVTANQIFGQIGSTQFGPVPLNVGAMDAGALRDSSLVPQLTARQATSL